MDAKNDTRNVLDRFKGMSVEDIASDLARNSAPLHIAIENLQHDFNIGSIVRSANAFNVAGVHIIGKKHWNRRGAMATEKYLKLYHHSNAKDFEEWANSQQMPVIGIDIVEGAIPLQSAELTRDSILVFGQEGPGLSDDLRAMCQQIVAIEQFGSTRSVNVGVAAGIVLYEWVRRNGMGAY